MVEELRAWITVTPKDVLPIPETPIPAGPQNPLLVQARSAVVKGQPNQAIPLYTQLLKQAYPAQEIILELQEALYRHPVDILLWQTLGDAFMRNGQLQDALDAYTKAEELLR
jgi:tetratricopeptide (TPR) repeat protein